MDESNDEFKTKLKLIEDCSTSHFAVDFFYFLNFSFDLMPKSFSLEKIFKCCVE